MGTDKLYIIAAILAVCALLLFFAQRRKRSEALVILAGIFAGGALALLAIALCLNAMFLRPLFD